MTDYLKIPIDKIGEVSDGYHTFNELYDHRIMLFIAFMNSLKENSWWSFKHNDGSKIENWMIAGISLPVKERFMDITYHIPIKHYQLLQDLKIPYLEKAPEWDGHKLENVLARIEEYLLNLK